LAEIIEIKIIGCSILHGLCIDKSV